MGSLTSITVPQALRAVMEHSRHPNAEPAGTEAVPAQFNAESAPLLVSIEDPAMKTNSSAVMVIGQQLDLVRMCFELASEIRPLQEDET